MLFDLSNEPSAIALSAVINLLPTYYASRRRYDLQVGTALGIMAGIQPSLLIYMLTGHPWQMEGHMYFFVGLAALMLLVDWRPIAAASVTIAIHHLALSYLVPEWVFIGSGDLARVLIHALAVGLVFAMLGPTAIDMARLFAEQADARDRSEQLAEWAREARVQAEDALALAEQAQRTTDERQQRLEAERSAHATARSRELLSIGDSFEDTVAKIVSAVGATATQLEQAAREMHRFAQDTGRHSAAVASEAEIASSNVLQLSSGVTDLTRSLATIAVTADQQAEMGEQARGSSRAGETAIRELATRTDNIEALIGLIHGVSPQTNLLAINATIEAARAGDSGRGFAIVASEVKLLARKAQEAAGEITSLVGTIGKGARDADGAIATVNATMQHLVQSADNMRSAIARQRDVAERIESTAVHSAAGTDAMARRIADVARAAGEAASLSHEVQGSADGLAHLAGELKVAADRFLVQLRAA